MHVALSRRIETDLQEIGDYIAMDNPIRARTFIEELESQMDSIGRNPRGYRLRPDLGPEVRLAAYGRYVILFRIMKDYVLIDRVVHGARDLTRLI